jgi:hypothetical protein
MHPFYTPCANGHTFEHADSGTSGRVPEGLRCQCGKYVAHWTRCTECGHERLVYVSVDPEGNIYDTVSGGPSQGEHDV